MSASAEFRLVPSATVRIDDPYWFGPGASLIAPASAERYPWVRGSPSSGAPQVIAEGTMPLAVWVVGGALALALGWWVPEIGIGIGALALVGAGAWVGGRIVGRRRMTPRIAVSRLVVAPGAEIAVTVSLVPRASVALSELVVELRAEETVDRHHSRRECVVAVQTERLLEGRWLRAGETSEAEARLVIPGDAPYSYAGVLRRVEWWVIARARVSGGPEGVARRKVVVRPGGADALAEASGAG